MGLKSMGLGFLLQGSEVMTRKSCPSYPGYSATDDGRVFTHRRRFGRGRGHGGGVEIDLNFSKELNRYKGHGGYMYVSISTERGQRNIPVHVILADAFVGVRPDGLEVRHLDGNPLNNDMSNLVFGTPKENAEDRVRCGNHTIGEKHGRAKLREKDVRDIRARYELGETVASISRSLCLGESTIRDIVKGRHWAHVH